jgi:N-acyl-L-homoserine lactone synthetase
MKAKIFEDKGYEVFIVHPNSEELAEIKKLRYKAYLDTEAIPDNPEQILTDKFDYADNTINHALYFEGKLIGAIRGLVAKTGENTLPSMLIYNDEIIREHENNSNLYESCRFVTDPDFNKSLHAQFYLIRANILAAYSLNCEHYLTAVRLRHSTFYTRMGMEIISEEKSYYGLNVSMVLLTGRNFNTRFANTYKTYPVLQFNDHDKDIYLKCLKELSLPVLQRV